VSAAATADTTNSRSAPDKQTKVNQMMDTIVRPQHVSTGWDGAAYPASQQPSGYNWDAGQPNEYLPADTRPSRGRGPRIDQTKFWVGALLTAMLTALGGIIGLVVAHGIAHVPVLFLDGSGLVPVHAAVYGLVTALIALVAAGLYNGMLHVAPRPAVYYCWLIGLLTLLAGLLPFTTAAVLSSQVALAAMNVLVGLIILVMVPLAAENARTER
jgi:Family of unknown function (DUF6069)